MGYSPWRHKELDMTEQLNTHTHHVLYLFKKIFLKFISISFNQNVSSVRVGILKLYPLLSHWHILHWCCSVTQSCLTLCNPVDCSTPGLPVLHHLLESSQVQVH